MLLNCNVFLERPCIIFVAKICFPKFFNFSTFYNILSYLDFVLYSGHKTRTYYHIRPNQINLYKIQFRSC
jgi:hypothetical protein